MRLFDTIGIDGSYVVFGLAGFSLILFILIIVLFAKNSKLRKRYEAFMQGEEATSLEKMFVKKFGEVDGLMRKTANLEKKMQIMDETLLDTYQKLGVVKYDAFEMGGKLSFALALLNEKNDGFIINCMHSTREGCYTYVKEIIKGESFVILAEEEKEALDRAMNAKENREVGAL